MYSDVEKFISSSWGGQGRADLSELSTLVSAWHRSHFLFDDSTTAYIRKLWVDTVQANYHHKVMTGEADGDSGAAAEEFHRILRECSDLDALRTKFLPQLKVHVGFADTLRAIAPWWPKK